MGMSTMRLTEMAAIMMIGDGLLTLMEPKRHVKLWRDGPEWWKAAMNEFLDHPAATRALAGVELAAGLWLAHHAQEHAASSDRC